MKKFCRAYCLLYIVYCLLFIVRPAFAAYVLPYPSTMPGNKLYRISRVVDQLKKYWYFGNIAQIKYHLGLADKYLVEAKILMEYKQYLLATDAINRSDREFLQLPKYLGDAKKEKKDMSLSEALIVEAAEIHRSVLSRLESAVPEQFIWTPEKEKPTELRLNELLRASEEIRSRVAREILAL